MGSWRVVREQPLCVRLKPDGSLRGLGLLALGGVMLALFVLAMLGWFRVVSISRDGWGVLGTLTSLAIGVLALYAGARAHWGWCELEVADVAITVVDGFGWRIRGTARIDRPTAGVPLTVAVELDPGPAYWVRVDNGEPRGRIEIARSLKLSRHALEDLAALIERWGRGEPPIR